MTARPLIVCTLVCGCSPTGPKGSGDDPRFPGVAGVSLLHRAALDNDVARARSLLDAGASVTAQDSYERTPLHFAAISDAADVAALLLDSGANLEARSRYDVTPTHIAAMMGSAEALAVLLERGASTRSRTIYGSTPLHEARRKRVVELLVGAGANIDARDLAGMTPLHLVSGESVAQALINAGANILARSEDGRRPIDMSVTERKEHPALVLHPHRALARLRRDQGETSLSLRNVSETAIRDVRVRVSSPACTVTVRPERIPTLHPAQRVTYRLQMQRLDERPQSDKEALTIEVRDVSDDVLLTAFVRLDTRTTVTPEDRGMVRAGQVQLRPSLGWMQRAAYFAVPLLLLAFWLLQRRLQASPHRRERRTE